MVFIQALSSFFRIGSLSAGKGKLFSPTSSIKTTGKNVPLVSRASIIHVLPSFTGVGENFSSNIKSSRSEIKSSSFKFLLNLQGLFFFLILGRVQEAVHQISLRR